jgi:hypothetical protein
VAAGAIALCGVALLAWRAPSVGPARQDAVSPPVAGARPSEPLAVVHPASAARAAVVQAAAPAAPQPDKAFVELCGVGLIPRSELEVPEGGGPAAWVKRLDEQSAEGLQSLLKRLDVGTPRQQVAAAVLRADPQRAAGLGVSSNDAVAYRMALQACRTHHELRRSMAHIATLRASGTALPELPDPGPEPTACAALNMEQLAALDSTDAWPWLAKLGDALEQGDTGAVTQALFQIGQREWRPMRVRLVSTAVAPLVGDAPGVGDAMAIGQALVKDGAALRDGSSSTLLRACRADLLKDANRRQLCEQATRRLPGMLSEMSDSVALHVLEERLGLPHSAQAMSKAEMGRAQQALSRIARDVFADPSCANFGRMARDMLAFARDGELAYVRAHRPAVAASTPG